MPCWSTISAGNLAAFPVLPGLDGLTILVDHDKPNPKTGKRRNLGTFPTRKAAEKHEREVQYFKRR